MSDNVRKRRRRRRHPQPTAPSARALRVGRELSSPLADRLARLIGGLVPNPDRTLEENSGEGLRLYSEMLRRDAQLAMCFRQRALGVMAQGWRVVPGGRGREAGQLAAWVEEALRAVRGLHLSRGRFFRGISHGYAPAEIMFCRRPDGLIGIDSFRSRDPERFRFDREGGLMLVGEGGDPPRPMPAAKFVLNSWGADETPYGQGLLRELYPLWYFKNAAVKELMRFMEKFGAPYLWASYPRGTSEAEQDALLEALRLMHSNAVGIGPEGTEFTLNEGGRQGVIEVFRFIIEEYVDRQYAKAVLGQTLSTESQSGTYALARFQALSQQHIIEDDALWQEEQLGQVIRTLVDLNFGPRPAAEYPVFRIPCEEEADLNQYLQGVSLAVNELGLTVGESWLREQAGFPPPGVGEPAVPGRRMPGKHTLS